MEFGSYLLEKIGVCVKLPKTSDNLVADSQGINGEAQKNCYVLPQKTTEKFEFYAEVKLASPTFPTHRLSAH